MNHTGTQQAGFSQLGERAERGQSVITRLMADELAHPEMLSLAAGFTDNRVLPEQLVREAVERLAADKGNAHLQYGMNRGRPGLRREVIHLLESYPGEEDLGLGEDNVLVTNGSQQGLYVLVQLFCDPGDFVLVEQPSYFVFLELLAGLGVRAVPLPVDPEGCIDKSATIDLFGRLRREGNLEKVKLAYLMGAFANPSTRCLGEAEKTGLREAFAMIDHPVPVIEDMAYRELYFDHPFPARSILALDEWRDYPCFYAGTFTKPFATGLKTGFLVCRDQRCLDAAAKIKGHQDFGSANFNQALIENVLQNGNYPGHLQAIRRHYREKRDLLVGALEAQGLSRLGWTWRQPEGGLLLWAEGPGGLDTRVGSAFHRSCVDQEILYVPGDLCFADGKPYHYVRLSFGALEAESIPEAARRFCAAAKAVG